MDRTANHDSRVLILAPLGRDADLIGSALAEAGIACLAARSAHELAEQLREGAALLLVFEEALLEAEIRTITSAIGEQPAWSDLPVIVITGGGAANRTSRQLAVIRKPLGNVSLQERPLRAVTLVSSVQSALRARQKQYQVRDQLQELQIREEALRQSEDQFRQFANALPQLAWIASADGSIFWYNANWFSYTGKTMQEMEGWGWQSVHDPEILPMVLAKWAGSIRNGTPFDMEFPLLGADGRFRWFLTRVVPIHDQKGALVRWVGTNTDIEAQREIREALRSNQERLESEVAKRTNALRRLSVQLLSAQDEERRRLARELHDSIGQYLVSVLMTFETLVNATPSIEAHRVVEMRELIESCLSETRTISHLLHPPLLDEIGLNSALKWFIDQFSARSGIEVRLNIITEDRLSSSMETMLFRVVQEALTNIHKHSGSATAEVTLNASAGEIFLEVKDFGKGMPKSRLGRDGALGKELGVGLAGMHERVSELGGDFRVMSGTEGTTIRVALKDIPVAPLT